MKAVKTLARRRRRGIVKWELENTHTHTAHVRRLMREMGWQNNGEFSWTHPEEQELSIDFDADLLLAEEEEECNTDSEEDKEQGRTARKSKWLENGSQFEGGIANTPLQGSHELQKT